MECAIREALSQRYLDALKKHRQFSEAMANLAAAVDDRQALDVVRVQAQTVYDSLVAAKYELETHLQTHRCAREP